MNKVFLLVTIFSFSLLRAQWFHLNTGVGANLPDLILIDSITCITVGENGIILKSTNAGLSWFSVSGATTSNLRNIDFVDNNEGIIVGDQGTVCKTTDEGQSWIILNSGTTTDLYGVDLITSMSAVAVGMNGKIIKTTDGGITWQSKTSGTGQHLWSVSFCNTSIGFAVGNDGVIVKTTDGGDSWTLINPLLINQLLSVSFYNQYGFIAGRLGLIMRTTDYGASWTFQNKTDNTLCTAKFINENIGFAGGYNGCLLKTTDGGDSWNLQLANFMGTIYWVEFADEYTGYAGGGGGEVIKTIHGGGVPVELSSFNAIQVNKEILLLWSTSSELNNRGFEIERKNNDSWRTIGFLTGHGTTTEPQNYTFTDNIYNVQSRVVYYRLRQVDFDGSAEYSNEIAVTTTPEYFLQQNHPNPFNPFTTIRYSISDPGKVRLIIYDAMGREIGVLVNELKTAGEYSVEFNSDRLASGVYFYRLEAGAYSEIRKMVLLR